LIERVEPNWTIDSTPSAASRASADSPLPSWPNSSTQARGSGSVSSGRAPGTLSTASSGSSYDRAQATSARDVRVVAYVLVAVGDHGGSRLPIQVAGSGIVQGMDTGPTEWGASVGLGPWQGPWPEDPRYDPELLAHGDRRNVVDHYRYWTVEAIRADLDTRRHPFHVAIENWQHDLNIGTVVRTANAFLAAEVHIVGRRRWNRRGAMITEKYQHLRHHADVADLAAYAAQEGLTLVAVDNGPGSVPIEVTPLPERCVLLFGQEGPGLTAAAREAAAVTVSIAQFGSTRSINAGVAAGIAMHAWIRQHAAMGGDVNPLHRGSAARRQP